MAPSRNPGVDYLRIYPGLNDFSDALEAIPQTLIGHITHLKEIKAKSGALNKDVGSQIKSYFKQRDPEKLRKLSAMLDALIPVTGQKMHIASLAAEQVSHQIDRLNTDYKMICEHEVPATVQIDNQDAAFVEIIPQEKQASLRSQARREAREAREARRANQQQDSRAGTPSAPENTPAPTVGRRRGRTATPLANYYSAAETQKSQSNDTHEPSPAPERTESAEPEPRSHTFNNAINVNPSESHLKVEPGAAAQHRAQPVVQSAVQPAAQPVVQPAVQPAAPNAPNDRNGESNEHNHSHNQNFIPPVVMPIADDKKGNGGAGGEDSKEISSPSTEGGAEVMIGLKRKRGSAPKSSEPVYCYCQRGSFGEMVGCDGPNCEREWFHLGCIGLSALPKGQWFCEECRAKLRRR